MTEDNVIEGPWSESAEDGPTDEEYAAAMEEITTEQITNMVGTVLELLTVYALDRGPYYILADNNKAITIIATDDDVEEVLSILPEKYRSWDDIQESEEFITNSDPGDEQNEPTA